MAESISLKIGMTGTTVNLKREQYNLVPTLMENSKFLNAKCYVNFTLNRPKDEKFYLDPKSIEIQLQGMRTLNIKKSYGCLFFNDKYYKIILNLLYFIIQSIIISSQ